MSDHLAEQQRTWSPGQAVAPCLTCQAGLCAEHGPARVETTTGGLPAAICRHCAAGGCVPDANGYLDPPLECGTLRINPDAKPHPEGASAGGLCRRCAPEAGTDHEAVPVTTTTVCPTCDGHRWGLRTPDGLCSTCHGTGLAPAPAAEATGEMSREAFEAALDPCAAQGWLLRHDACLRTRAREAEERAEKTTEHLLNSVARAVRRGDELERERDAERYMRGVNQRAAENAEKAVAVVVNERDEAREQRDAAVKKRDAWRAVAENTERDRVAQLAAANGRAEAYQKDRDLTGYRLAAAEAEVKRLRDVLHLDRSGLANALNRVRDTARGYRWIPAGEWGSYDYTGQTMETLRKEIGWMLDGVEKTAAEALGQSGDLAHAECCGGERKEIPVERENAALRERCRRLVAAGDRLVFRIVNPDARFDLEAWAAAKGALDAPAADGGEG